MAFERVECFRPIFAAMNIGAIREMQPVVQFHLVKSDG